MFGTYRTILALLVVATHLGPVANVGPYAVFAFYVLSGYLMTAILHRTYGYSARGLLRYGANRLLRILPLYWLAALLGVAGVLLLGEPAARRYHEAMGLVMPTTDVLRNLALVLTVDTPTRWVPPAWALTVEVFYYALIGLGLSRWRWGTVLWFCGSLVYTAYLVFGGAAFSYRYFPLAAASLPFSLGALVFHLRQHLHGPATSSLVTASVVGLFFLNVMSAPLGGTEVWRLQFYANLVLAAGCVYCLAGLTVPRHRRTDAALGDLSDPVYLMHYAAGMGVVLLGVGGTRGEWSFLAVGAVLTLLLGWLASAILEPAIQAVRNRVRGDSSGAQP